MVGVKLLNHFWLGQRVNNWYQSSKTSSCKTAYSSAKGQIQCISQLLFCAITAACT